MKGIVKDVYAIYDSNDKQLIIPVYQRNYDWQVKQCEQLLADLVSMSVTGRPKHFFGAVVGKMETSWSWIVIDGQQRLTTVSLLMLALAKLIASQQIEAKDTSLGEKIMHSYLINGGKNGEAKFRLKPVKNDAKAYNLLFGDESHWIESSNVTANFRYFLAEIPRSGLTAEQLWNAITNLEVMHLDLEGHDDPQRIFESLNSTGLALSESDKIRNLVLMDLDSQEQERVYNDYWNRIEENVAYETDNFIRWYLVTKTTKTPRFDQIYESFKTFALASGKKGADLLAEIRDYSLHYSQIRNACTGFTGADRMLKRLNILKQDVILPLLMPLLSEVRQGLVSPEDFASSLQTVDSYLTRRFICNYGTAGLNGLFSTLYRELKKIRPADVSFSDALTYSLTKRAGNAVFPQDDAFRQDFITRDFYKISLERRRYLFESLENSFSKDVSAIDEGIRDGNLSIEHIMPQTLTAAWRAELGPQAEEIHAEWLHRIGNLTVTAYNSKYSNASFIDKKTMEFGFNDSPYRLNRLIKESDSWGAEQLEQRANELLNTALKLWPFPETTFEPPRAALPIEELGSDTDFTHTEITAFTFNDVHMTVWSWREMFVELLKIIANQDRDHFSRFAEKSTAFRFDDHSNEVERGWHAVAPGWFVWAASSTWSKTHTLRAVLNHFDIDPSEVVVTLRTKRPTNDTTEAQENEPEGPYSSLTKFMDLMNEVAETDNAPEDTAELRKEFAKEFEQFKVAAPLKELGMAPALFAADPERMIAAEPKHIFALISAKYIEEATLDPNAVHNAITSGEISAWLSTLVKELSHDPTPPERASWTTSLHDRALAEEIWPHFSELARSIFNVLIDNPGVPFTSEQLGRRINLTENGVQQRLNVGPHLVQVSNIARKHGMDMFWRYSNGDFWLDKDIAEMFRVARDAAQPPAN